MMCTEQATIGALLNATDDSVILVDTNGIFLALNEEAARRRNKNVDELVGKSLYDHLDPSVVDNRRERIERAVRHKVPVFFEEDVRDKCFFVSVYPVVGKDGEVAQVASYSRDRTDGKFYEMQLVEAKEMAESASLAKSQFLANMSHELRTPLNGILGIAQVALGDGVGGRSREHFEIIYKSGVKLLGLVNNLIDLAAMERRAVEPDIKKFVLSDTLASLKKSYSLQARLHEIELLFDMDGDVPSVLWGDEAKLRQILSNLISNALQSTDSGFVKVTASLACGEVQQNDYVGVCFSVEDSGVGIDGKALATIFDGFTITEDVLTKRRSGAGVGLGIVKILVEMLGGTIKVKSNVGVGTNIVFTIPFAHKCSDAMLDEYGDGEEDRVQQEQDGSCTVMIVEDDGISLETTAMILARKGFDVVTAVNGLDALKKLCHTPVDVILMDIQMPEMDGLKATSHIRNGEISGLRKDIPIIALTAYSSERDRDRFIEAGMDDFIAKPFDSRRLVEVIRACRRRSAMA